MPLARMHVIPVGGAEPVHVASPNCWCYPAVKTLENPAPAYHPDMIVHNADDKRERWEQVTGRPRDPGAKWVNVCEEVP
jgi:hypothetical protein